MFEPIAPVLGQMADDERSSIPLLNNSDSIFPSSPLFQMRIRENAFYSMCLHKCLKASVFRRESVKSILCACYSQNLAKCCWGMSFWRLCNVVLVGNVALERPQSMVTLSIRIWNFPAGAFTSTVSPAFRPIRARPMGELQESLP